MRRILDAIKTDLVLLSEIEKIMCPCLFQSLTVHGIDSIEEGLDCISLILYYGYKDRCISHEMWKLYP